MEYYISFTNLHIALEYDRNNSLHHNAEQIDVRVVYREVQRNKPCAPPDP